MTGTFAGRIAQLGPAQRELLERRLDAPPSIDSPLMPRNRDGVVPASPTQKSMWFVHNLDPASAMFNNTHCVRIRGPLDVDALEWALAELVRRHEVLRTNYLLIDGELMQIVREPPESVLEVKEAPGQSAELSEELRRTVEALASQPFDLENGPMYRAVLHKLAADDFILTRTNHHISFDRWSVAIANREITELYGARQDGRDPLLPELGIQYADFAQWQLDNLSADAASTRLRFFTSHIAGVPDSLEFPTDHPRTGAQGPAATLRKELPTELASRLRTLGRELSATPFMILLASFGMLMGRYTRSKQILVGVPVALRSRPELTDLIGPLINTVVLRLDLRGEPSFRELVERIRRTSMNMIAHQDLPFDELVRAVAPEREAVRTPLFQIMFDYLNTPNAELDLESTHIESIPLETGNAAHDLTLYIEDRPAGIGCRWEYRSDLLERASVASLANAYDAMIGQLITDPELRIDDVGMLDPADQGRVRSLSAGQSTPPRPPNILEAIETTRSQAPEAVAVEYEGKGFTYDQLAGAAQQIATGLTAREVQSGDAVALVLDRSFELIAAFLGVMMVGGAAVLVDRDQPSSRLLEILDIAGPAATLINVQGDTFDERFAPISLDSLLPDAHPDSTPAMLTPLVTLGPNDPAYIVFTSGSTGTPKGVVVGHGSLANFVESAVSLYDLGTADRMLQFASPGFDTFVEEVLPTLYAGAAVVLRPDELFASFATFERFVEDEGITVLDLPTAWWHSWVADIAEGGRSLAPSLRLVIVGGEAAMAHAWRDWSRLAGNLRWINSYGPSEGTVVVSTFEPTADYRPTSRIMPIGSPIPNTSLRVVDAVGLAVPLRVPGEILIEGDAVALGYLGEGLQSGGFETDPVTGQRRFRTGDLARLLSDGSLEFLGRLDSQVKVRGTRVEPAEVEAALEDHPDVVEAVVVSGRNGDSGLAAHVVVTTPELDVNLLRRHLAERLPEPMIPTTWTKHDAIPLTFSGKQDRRVLERIEAHPVKSLRSGIVKPTSETEAQLLEIWETVLGRSDISTTDSFFDLGGHSLLGVKMISRISSAIGVHIPLRALFDTPTIEQMAKSVEAANAG